MDLADEEEDDEKVRTCFVFVLFFFLQFFVDLKRLYFCMNRKEVSFILTLC